MIDHHDDIMDAVRAYYKAHHDWVNKQTRRSGTILRKRLSELRRICSMQRVEIQDWRHDIDQKKAQKKTGSGDDHAN
jgi:hypothetical protein